MLVHDRVAVDLRVHRRVGLERQAGGLHEERHVRQLDALFLLDAFLETFTEGGDRRHVDLVERGQVRRLMLRQQQIFRDPLATRRHLLARFARAGWRHRRGWRRRSSGGSRSSSLGRDRERRHHICFRHHAATAGTCDIGRIDPGFRGQAGRRRRHLHVAARRYRRGQRGRHRGRHRNRHQSLDRSRNWSRRRRRSRCNRGRSHRHTATGRDLTQLVADVYHIAFTLVPFRKHSGFKGGHFNGDLIGLEFDQRIAGGNVVTLVLEPAGNGRLDDGFAERWNLDGRHVA